MQIPTTYMIIGGAIALGVATFAVSYLKRRAKRTKTTVDDDIAEALGDAVDDIKDAIGLDGEKDEK